MLQRIRKVREGESDSGFTLTELLITIVILGVLAAIVVFAVGAFSDDGKVAACKTDMKNVEVAVEAYIAKESKPPATVDILVPGYLKQAPDGKGYVIHYDSATGKVTGTLGSGTAPCA